MKVWFENIMLGLVHYLYGPHPDLHDALRLLVLMLVLWMLILHLAAGRTQILVNAWVERRAEINLARLADRLGFQTRREGKMFARIFVGEGAHRGRTIRFFTYRWRGAVPMVGVAATCRQPAGLWVQIRPKLGWMMQALTNHATFRLQDLRSNDFRLRALPVGDPAFDKAYAVKSNQFALAVKLLTPTIQAELMAVRQPTRSAPTITIAEGEVRYFITAKPFGANAVDSLRAKMDLVCDLAEAVEKLCLENSPALMG
jgi:hypothetical protein